MTQPVSPPIPEPIVCQGGRESFFSKLNASTWIGLTIVLTLVLMATFAPLLATHDPARQNIMDALAMPGSDYLLGADQFGRDIWSRLLFGARYSLTIGFFAIIIAMIVGTLIGMIAGYVGGKVDIIFMQIMDVVLAFPALILGLAMVAMLGATLTNIIIAIAF